MDYRSEAIEELKLYPQLRQSLVSITNRIKSIEEKMQSAKGSSLSLAPARGGGRTNEDRLAEGLDDIDELRELYISTEDQVCLIDEGLSVLNEQERRIIEVFYIQTGKKKIDYLIEELMFERTTIYKLRDEALEKYISVMFGVAV
jgi:hypothetical protein